ncbi:MAG: 4'-phosphopantetheinyl transferase superfamily protein [Frankiaceae bacterium]|nr:4'-phosphopantetheinyl transferase superfamily protein [Frankiaceae bacterium]
MLLGVPHRVGIDLIAVEDVAAALSAHGERYLARVYTDREVQDCAGPAGPDPLRLAARFAAKEATMKVLRPGDAAVPWPSVEVRRNPGGDVELALTGAAKALAEDAGLSGFAVSLTHDGAYAAAVVVADHAPTALQNQRCHVD